MNNKINRNKLNTSKLFAKKGLTPTSLIGSLVIVGILILVAVLIIRHFSGKTTEGLDVISSAAEIQQKCVRITGELRPAEMVQVEDEEGRIVEKSCQELYDDGRIIAAISPDTRER